MDNPDTEVLAHHDWVTVAVGNSLAISPYRNLLAFHHPDVAVGCQSSVNELCNQDRYFYGVKVGYYRYVKQAVLNRSEWGYVDIVSPLCSVCACNDICLCFNVLSIDLQAISFSLVLYSLLDYGFNVCEQAA